jgi:hypothetical protein
VSNKKPKHDINYLVVLQYNSNNCYTDVTKLDINNLPGGVLSVDPSEGTWQAKNARLGHWPTVNLRIGVDVRRCDDTRRFGVIGIYDCTNVTHLGKMISDAKEATRKKMCYVSD